MNDEELLKLVNEYLEYQPATGELIWKKGKGRVKSGQVAGYDDDDKGYRCIKINSKPYKIHRINYLIHHGRMPKMLDHLNQIKNDNRIENLRESNGSQNQGNVSSRANNTSGFRGVTWVETRQKWAAKGPKFVKGEWKQGSLGYFDCPKEAYKVYKKAAKAYFKEFFPKDLE